MSTHIAPDVDVSIEIEHSTLYNKDLAPVPTGTAHVARRQFRGALDFDVGLHPDLHARVVAHRRRHELVAGDPHDLPRQLDRRHPMILNAHAGTRYGIPFPVFCRASFGTVGANVPALMRAFVACGWFGIQTWIGGAAIYKIMGVFFPALARPARRRSSASRSPSSRASSSSGRSTCSSSTRDRVDPPAAEHQSAAADRARSRVARVGVSRSRRLRTDPFAAIAFAPGQPKAGEFWAFFIPGLTGMIGFWATLSLNIPDFSRYARTQRDQVVGQALGLPLTMALYAFIGVAVTSATTIIYGAPIWDPVDVLTKFTNPIVLVVAMFALCLATLATNIAANVVSPANDFAHLAPRKISFRMGGLITGIIGVLMMPWKLVADPSGYIFTWLVGYSALLGPIGGIMIADYFVVRRRRLNVPALYDANGEYRYTNGFSIVALIALAVAILPNLPGFLVNVKLLDAASVPPFLVTLYSYAWFVGFGIAFFLYIILRRVTPAKA
jgi:NCS1 family nucleobase:cation symporter-1